MTNALRLLVQAPGTERKVYFDEANHIVIKLTKPGEFGIGNAGLEGHMERLAEANEAFEDGVQVVGRLKFPGEPASRVVTVELWRVADPQRPEPRQREIDVYLRARKSHWPRRSQDGLGRQGDFSAIRLSSNKAPMTASDGRGNTVQQGNISEQSPSGTGSTVWVDPNTGVTQNKAQDLVNKAVGPC